MNRTEFFSVAKITKAPVSVKQHGANGYGMYISVQHEGEEAQEHHLMYQGEPRYFKSLNGIETTLKENGILSFTVKLEKDAVEKRTRTKKEEEKK